VLALWRLPASRVPETPLSSAIPGAKRGQHLDAAILVTLAIQALENGSPATVPLSRDLVAMLLVQLHMAAGQLDWAESAATQLKDSPVANALRLQLAVRRQQDRAARPRR
jgi:lipopolysaccharide biosynthesis regulator YciM